MAWGRGKGERQLNVPTKRHELRRGTSLGLSASGKPRTWGTSRGGEGWTLTSRRIEAASRLRSLPLVNGTIQKAHMLLHPRMIERYADVEPCG